MGDRPVFHDCVIGVEVPGPPARLTRSRRVLSFCLSADSMMLSPIIEREFRLALRQRRNLLGRTLAARISVAVISFLLLGSALFGWSWWMNLVHYGLILAGLHTAIQPALELAPGLFTEERRNHTMPLLWLTGMCPRELFASKLGSGIRLDLRRRWLVENPVIWLGCQDRQPVFAATTWLTGLGLLWGLGWWFWPQFWLAPVNLWTIALILLGGVHWIFVRAAARRMAVDRRDGLLELFLTTPLSPAEIAEGHRIALLTQFRPSRLICHRNCRFRHPVETTVPLRGPPSTSFRSQLAGADHC